jgi:hypothetical protein
MFRNYIKIKCNNTLNYGRVLPKPFFFLGVLFFFKTWSSRQDWAPLTVQKRTAGEAQNRVWTMNSGNSVRPEAGGEGGISKTLQLCTCIQEWRPDTARHTVPENSRQWKGGNPNPVELMLNRILKTVSRACECYLKLLVILGPPLWSSGQSSWLQIQGSRFRFPGTTKVVGLERGPLSLVNTTEELLDRKVAAPV